MYPVKNSFKSRLKKVPFYLILWIISLFHLPATAQNKIIIGNGYLFYQVRLPGMQRVDRNGLPVRVIPDSILIVYVETNAKEIKWENAWRNGRYYTIASQGIVATPYKVGRQQAITAGKEITLGVGKNNYLWQLYISPKQPWIRPPLPVNKNILFLKGFYKGRTIYKKIATAIELEAIPSV